MRKSFKIYIQKLPYHLHSYGLCIHLSTHHGQFHDKPSRILFLLQLSIHFHPQILSSCHDLGRKNTPLTDHAGEVTARDGDPVEQKPYSHCSLHAKVVFNRLWVFSKGYYNTFWKNNTFSFSEKFEQFIPADIQPHRKHLRQIGLSAQLRTRTQHSLKHSLGTFSE